MRRPHKHKHRPKNRDGSRNGNRDSNRDSSNHSRELAKEPLLKPQFRYVIGVHSAREAIKVRPRKISEIWLKEGADRDHELTFFIEFAHNNKIKCLTKPLGFLDKLSSSHQGVCLLVTETPEYSFAALQNTDHERVENQESEKIILIALDQITDPHNTGAVLRTAWLLGAKALLVPENRSGHLTPTASKVASGGAEHVPLVVVDNLAQTLNELKEKGFWIYGLSSESKQLQWSTRFHEKVVLVAGAEDKGLRSTTAKACDEFIAIPQTDQQASFNASVAVGLALYEVTRQHHNFKKP